MHSLVVIELDTHAFMYRLLCVLVSFLQCALQISAPHIGPRQVGWLRMETRRQYNLTQTGELGVQKFEALCLQRGD